MPRKVRVEYPGAIYHLMNRGDRREPIFKDDEDRRLFLATLSECCGKTDWQVHFWCLMPNHFHVVVGTPTANLVAGMKWFLGTYTARFNRRHQLFAHLLSGRYKALAVDGSGNGYLKTVCDYVHLNPARAKLLSVRESLKSFEWSSYPNNLKASAKRPGWLRVNQLLGEHGIPNDSAVGRAQFEARMEQVRASEDTRGYPAIRRRWCFGEKAFRKELLNQVAERVGEYHYAEERQGSGEEKARGIVATELKRLGWTAEDLKARRKGDVKKVRIAQRLRAETTVTLKWIAGELRMGTWTQVSNLLSKQRRKSWK